METNKKNLLCILLLIAFASALAASSNTNDNSESSGKLSDSVEAEVHDKALPTSVNNQITDSVVNSQVTDSATRVKPQGRYKCLKYKWKGQRWIKCCRKTRRGLK